MAHPSDAALHITLGRDIDIMVEDRVLRLIREPTERNAGYIEALRDVQRMMLGEPPIVKLPPPTQEK